MRDGEHTGGSEMTLRLKFFETKTIQLRQGDDLVIFPWVDIHTRSIGIGLRGDNAVWIRDGASVHGRDGIDMTGSGSAIYNIGALAGSITGISDLGGNNQIVNAGEVTAGNTGISVQPLAGRTSTSTPVFNFGVIHAEDNGIL
jgi:hypothetical protein